VEALKVCERTDNWSTHNEQNQSALLRKEEMGHPPPVCVRPNIVSRAVQTSAAEIIDPVAFSLTQLRGGWPINAGTS